MTRPLPRPRERPEPVEQPLHLRDLVTHDAAELGHEAVVASPPRQELGKRLDRHQRVLDLVSDPGRQHLEIGKPLGALPLHLERLQRREIAEDGDGSQDGARLIVQR